MGVHRLFGNNLSVIKDAILTPSSVKTSSDIFATETKRAGSGTAMLLGNFTGIDDALFELRIVSGEGEGRTTCPVFIGVGTGVLSGVGISGVANQDFIIQLADLGIDTLNAEFDLGGVVLRALVSGIAGNDIFVSVDISELVFTETTFATFEAISAGTTEFTGPQWDWNTAVLNSNGEIPVEGMRLKFENDPQIYRQYKIRVASNWVYYLSPGAVRAIPTGSKVYEVTGHRRVTITDGVDIEQYTHVKTLYDFVSQVRDDSLLVEVVGIVADDKTPGGMNCQDFSFITDAYMHPIVMEGSKYVQKLDDIELQEATNTEILEIECVGNSEMGYEAWAVKGSVTGNLPGVHTAENYIYGPLHFTIPEMLIDYSEPTGDMGSIINYVARDAGEKKPPICLENRVLGVKAKTDSVTFRYTENLAVEGCECGGAQITGAVSADCLGLEDLGGEENLADLNTDYRTRLVDLYEYIDQFTRDNTCYYDEVSKKDAWRVVCTLVRMVYPEGSCCIGDPVSSQQYRCTYYEYFSSDAAAQARVNELVNTEPWCIGHTKGDCDPNYPDYNTGAGCSLCSSYYMDYYHYYENISYEGVGTGQIIAANTDLNFMKAAFSILLDTLVQIYEVPASLILWDALLVELKVDLDLLRTKPPESDFSQITKYSKKFLERYQGAANLALLAAGIVPGKSRSSSEGAGCWSERGDAFYWKASGSYLPAYTNVVYHSAKLNADGEVYSTKEFACTIVCACPEHLKVGDEVTVSFDVGGNQVNTYQLGDKFLIPIIAAKDLELSGGVDGNDTHTWKVDGSVIGHLPDYLSIAGSETPYNQGGLQFLIERGGIPFELGDQWTFSVEGGKFYWKKDGGAWSAELNIGSQALSDGVSVMFTDGPAPSFVEGDIFKFKAMQPNSAEHVKHPTSERWTWIGSSGTLTIDCGGVVSVSEIFVADHNISNTATILIEGSQDGFLTTDWSEPMGWNEAVLTKVLTAAATVTHLRLKVTNADDCYVGWVCAGVSLSTVLSPALSLSRKYASISGGSLLAGGSIPIGVGWGGQLSWENSISQSELLQLITMLDHLKENNNEPVILLPHILHEEEGKLCRIDTEMVEITDIFDYQPDDKAKRIQSVTIPLEPVYL